MLVGLISNTSGRADSMAAAAAVLRDRGADFLVHCGDVGGHHVLDELARMESGFVWGDRDTDRMGLFRYARNAGVLCYGVLGEIDLGDKRAVVLHGDDRKIVRRLLDEQQYDYLFCGHDPAGEDRKVGRTRVINPGELQGGPSQNCAVLSTTSDEVKFFTLSSEPPEAGKAVG